LFEIFDKTRLAYDTFITNAYGKMRTTKFLHYTTTSNTYDTVELTFSPYHTMNQAALPSESYLVIDMNANYYQRDVDLNNVYTHDNLGPFISGYDLSYLMVPTYTGG
jgi:hypothetical protein